MFEVTPSQIHRDEGRENGDGQREDSNQRRAEVEQEKDDDEADDDGLFEQVALQRFDRRIDQPGAVVSRHDLYTGGKRWRNLRGASALTPLMTSSAFMP